MKAVKYVVGVVAGLIALTIVFVKAGGKGSQSGGQQVATILKAGGKTGSELINAITGTASAGK